MIRVLASLLFLFAVAAYAAPSIIAILRAHRRWPLVVAIDILLGWTIAGWLVAFAMALGLQLPKRKKRPKRRIKRAFVSASPVTNSAPARDAPAVREVRDPPQAHDESYARWLDGGAAIGG